MSRLTGNGAKSLMEAYTSVYTPQELTEEQIWEEVEAWVNALLEEGHDMSEFTWEEIYQVCADEILSEQPQRGSGIRNAPADRAAQQFDGFVNFIRGLGSQGTIQGRRRSRSNRPTPVRPAPSATPVRPAPSATPVRPAPAATPTKPAGGDTAPSTPTRNTVADRTTTPAPTQAAPKRSFNPLMQRTFGYQTGQAPDQVAARNAAASSALSGRGALSSSGGPRLAVGGSQPAPRPAAGAGAPAPDQLGHQFKVI